MPKRGFRTPELYEGKTDAEARERRLAVAQRERDLARAEAARLEQERTKNMPKQRAFVEFEKGR